MNEREMRERVDALYKQAEGILLQEDMTAEDATKVERITKSADDLLGRLERVGEIRKRAREGVLAPREEQADGENFASWPDFLTAVWKANSRNPVPRVDSRLLWFADRKDGDQVVKAMSGEVGGDGGFLIPPDFQATLMGALPAGSVMRAGATIWPMGTRTVTVPALDQESLAAADQPAWFGGLSFSWGGEGGEKPESQAKFREITLQAKKLIGYTVSSDELIADSAISLGAFLSGPLGFVGGVRFFEDYSFLRGTGVTRPLGVLNAPVTLTIPRATAGTITYVDLIRMMSRSLSLAGSVWIITQQALATLPLMEGPSGNPRYLWGSAEAGIPTSLLGLPVLWTEKLPAVGVRGDIILANRSYYIIGDRQATTIETTQYDRWRHDQTSWRVVHRVDGAPWLDAPIPLLDGVTTVSPFVVLGPPAQGA